MVQLYIAVIHIHELIRKQHDIPFKDDHIGFKLIQITKFIWWTKKKIGSMLLWNFWSGRCMSLIQLIPILTCKHKGVQGLFLDNFQLKFNVCCISLHFTALAKRIKCKQDTHGVHIISRQTALRRKILKKVYTFIVNFTYLQTTTLCITEDHL